MPLETAQLHIQRGNAAFRQGDYGAAALEFTQGIAKAPDPGNAYINRAQAHRRLRDIDAAVADFRQGLELASGDCAAHFAFGEFLVALRRPDKALAPLAPAAELRPDWSHVHVRLALAVRMRPRPIGDPCQTKRRRFTYNVAMLPQDKAAIAAKILNTVWLQ